MSEQINWHSETRKISELNPAPYNPRYLTEKQAKDIQNSLDEFGLADPIVINLNNTIIGGHQRVNILKAQGVQEIDVRIPSRLLTEAEERRLNLRLNKNIGSWDLDALANFNDEELLSVGFEASTLDEIFDLKLGQIDKDETPDAPEVPQAKLGDIYKLGDHRVMCGDSTDPKHLEALLSENGAVLKADMVFTDPPYNVNYAGKGEHTSEVIENDNLDPEQFNAFIAAAFENIYESLRGGGSVLHLLRVEFLPRLLRQYHKSRSTPSRRHHMGQEQCLVRMERLSIQTRVDPSGQEERVQDPWRINYVRMEEGWPALLQNN